MSVITCDAKALHSLDTDGDKVAMTDDKKIVKHVIGNDLPMLYDEGKKGGKALNNRKSIYKYDHTTILASIMSIGELTNMSTTWKDIATQPAIMKELGLNQQLIDNNVCILRFSQGTSIDYAKTGFFFEPPTYAKTLRSPHWKPWSRAMQLVGFKGAKVYESGSQLGQLYDAVVDYLKNKFKQETQNDTRDFTYEFTDNVDYAEMKAVKPVIAELDRAYRTEISALTEMKLSDDERNEYIIHLIDKYRSAVLSIDADIRSVAAAAYTYSYYESSSKSSKISFPWVTSFEGLLLNVSETSTASLKLRKIYFEGHLDDVPDTVTIYRNKYKDENIVISAKLPNGKYEVHKRNGSAYAIMKSKSVAKKRHSTLEYPVDPTILFQINSFETNGYSAQDIIDLLKENNGMIKIRRVKDRGQKINSLHAGVWIGEKRVANVNRTFKHTLIPYLQKGAVVFKVQDTDQLSATYIQKKTNKVRQNKFFALSCVLVEMVEEEKVVTKSIETEDYIPYYGDEASVPADYEYAPLSDEIAPIEIELEEDEEVEFEVGYYTFDKSIMNQLKSKATYWNVSVDPAEYSIIGATIEKTDQGTEVVLIRDDSRKARFVVAKNSDTKQIEIVSNPPKNERLHALALQIAHFEMYRIYLENKKQA